ncbi:hypothetical protein MiSe_22070 [Microseira wollei NIES-4236]|uniref:Uncharacterized protein n=1 Tax=Microseira wollei NIES-4236 TaxID=2530354 RepID=A0AAV3XAM1_9CYAN|nr:hypothetical protein MiSe_22070 [Microseira wollei NIES-4236]
MLIFVVVTPLGGGDPPLPPLRRGEIIPLPPLRRGEIIPLPPLRRGEFIPLPPLRRGEFIQHPKPSIDLAGRVSFGE